jgi:SAM-dependent methyltransferase
MLRDIETVLDIGCGTGALVHVLSERGKQVSGLDGSARMIDRARRFNQDTSASFLVGDILDGRDFTLISSELLEQAAPSHGSVARASPGSAEPATSALSRAYEPMKDEKKPFDLVVSSYVLHGLTREQRLKLYAIMKNLAGKRVVIMDYNQRRGWLTSFVEWLEGGDYEGFILAIHQEMKENFSQVHSIQTGKRAAWYICECDHRSAGRSSDI